MVPSHLYCSACGAENQAQDASCFACGQSLRTTIPLTHPWLLAPNHLLKQRYRILNEVGQGGFGAVYKAEDIQLSNRFVAVKEMSQYNLHPQQIQEASDAFKREAHILAGLHHPNLPSIHEHFEEAGRCYLVMDFIQGETLEDYVTKKGGKLPIKEVLDIGIQLCTVLAYLHTGYPPIIFRDLNPRNIMRTPDEHFYLIDFGIARHFKPGQSKDTRIIGTPGYAPIEQYGKVQTTPRSDIYSLGATLHQLLSGDDPSHLPFKFAPLSRLAIPADLGMLIMKMVEMDADKRPASARSVKQELQRIAGQLMPSQPGGQQPVNPPPLAVQPQAPLHLQLRPQLPQRVAPKALRRRSQPSLGMLLFGVIAVVLGLSVVSLGLWQSHASSTNPLRTQSTRTSTTSKAQSTVSLTVLPTTTPSSISKPIPSATPTPQGTVLSASGGAIGSIAWSPNGKFIAAGYQSATIRVWDTTTKSLDGAYAGVFNIAWSPDSKYIASSDDAGSILVWEALTEKDVLTHSGGFPVAWSPNGKYIASGSGNTVEVWAALTGNRITMYRGHSARVSAIAWSPDSRYIASGGGFEDGTVQVWEATTGNIIAKYNGDSSKNVESVAWSHDGIYILGGTENSVYKLEASTGKPTLNYQDSYYASTVVWSPNDKYVLFCNQSGVIVKSATSDKLIAHYYVYQLEHHYSNEFVGTAAWSPNGKLIAWGDEDVELWQAPS
jgi:serine/threonine protein kinase